MNSSKTPVFSRSSILGFLLVIASLSLTENAVSAPSPQNVVLVSIDTLRADHLRTYGYMRDTAPFLDSLGQQGIIFDNAFTASSHTAPSHASMFTALFPYQHQVLRNLEALHHSAFHLAGFAQEMGFAVAGFPAVDFLEQKVGFPQIRDDSDSRTSKKKRYYKSAEKVVARALNWIKKQSDEQPLFLWVHFYDVHEWENRRQTPRHYFELFEDEPPSSVIDFLVKNHGPGPDTVKNKEAFVRRINQYDSRIRFVDDQLKRLYLAMQKMGRNSDTLWVVTSDHGEGLRNHRYKGHGEYIYQEQLHVPLIFHRSNKTLKGRRKQLVRTVDIFPTIAEVLQRPIDQRKNAIEGVSLHPLFSKPDWPGDPIPFSLAQRRPKDSITFRRRWVPGEVISLHSLNEKLIYHSRGQDEFFQLSRDPFETKSLPEGARYESLRKFLLEKVRDYREEENNDLPADPNQVEELKALGYL